MMNTYFCFETLVQTVVFFLFFTTLLGARLGTPFDLNVKYSPFYLTSL